MEEGDLGVAFFIADKQLHPSPWQFAQMNTRFTALIQALFVAKMVWLAN